MPKARTDYRNINNVLISSEGNVGEMLIYGVIGQEGFDWFKEKEIEPITAEAIIEAIRKLEDEGCETIKVRINSIGGNIAEGNGIINALRRSKCEIHTYNDSIAASMGAVIWASGSKRFMARNTALMFHEATGFASGTAADLRKMADVLDVFGGLVVSVIAEATGKPEEDVRTELMSGGDHWMNIDAARSFGFEVFEEDADKKPEFKLPKAADRVAEAQAQMRKIQTSYRQLAAAAILNTQPQKTIENVTKAQLDDALAQGHLSAADIQAALDAHAAASQAASEPPAAEGNATATAETAPAAPAEDNALLKAISDLTAKVEAQNARIDALTKEPGASNARVPAPANAKPQATDGTADNAISSFNAMLEGTKKDARFFAQNA